MCSPLSTVYSTRRKNGLVGPPKHGLAVCFAKHLTLAIYPVDHDNTKEVESGQCASLEQGVPGGSAHRKVNVVGVERRYEDETAQVSMNPALSSIMSIDRMYPTSHMKNVIR